MKREELIRKQDCACVSALFVQRALELFEVSVEGRISKAFRWSHNWGRTVDDINPALP